MLIGIALHIGAWQLLIFGASQWPDIVAQPSTTFITAIAMAALGTAFFVSVVGVVFNYRWCIQFALTTLLVFTIGGFVGNYLLFGNIRWMHSGTNLIVVIVITILLIAGTRRRDRETGK